MEKICKKECLEFLKDFNDLCKKHNVTIYYEDDYTPITMSNICAYKKMSFVTGLKIEDYGKLYDDNPLFISTVKDKK